MPKFLIQWFVYCLLIGFFVAYLAAHTLQPGANYLEVFAWLGPPHSWPMAWDNKQRHLEKRQMWSNTIKRSPGRACLCIADRWDIWLVVAALIRPS